MYRAETMRSAMSDQKSDQGNATDRKLHLPFQDVLWAVGILAVIFGLTPVIVLYLLTMNWHPTSCRAHITRDIAGCVRFLSLIQYFDLPLWYGRSRRFETNPSKPNSHRISMDWRSARNWPFCMDRPRVASRKWW
jgi:hypothetical protein